MNLLTTSNGFKILDKLNENKFIIFGTTKASKIAYEYLSNYNIYPDLFFDNFSTNNLFNNIDIKKPTKSEIYKDYIILICSSFTKDIIKQLNDLGYNDNNMYIFTSRAYNNDNLGNENFFLIVPRILFQILNLKKLFLF
jgi:hypothetical protein